MRVFNDIQVVLINKMVEHYTKTTIDGNLKDALQEIAEIASKPKLQEIHELGEDGFDKYLLKEEFVKMLKYLNEDEMKEIDIVLLSALARMEDEIEGKIKC